VYVSVHRCLEQILVSNAGCLAGDFNKMEEQDCFRKIADIQMLAGISFVSFASRVVS